MTESRLFSALPFIVTLLSLLEESPPSLVLTSCNFARFFLFFTSSEKRLVWAILFSLKILVASLACGVLLLGGLDARAELLAGVCDAEETLGAWLEGLSAEEGDEEAEEGLET